MDGVFYPLPDLQWYVIAWREHLCSRRRSIRNALTAVLVLRRWEPVPHQGKALDTARGRGELCHSLKDVRKGKQMK